MSITYTVIKAEDNYRNSFLADEDKLGDQIVASITFDGREFSGMGDTQEIAIEDLRDQIDGHFNAQKHIAKTEIDKAIGQYFFD